MATKVDEVILKGLHEITRKLTAAEATDWVIVVQDIDGSPTVRVVSLDNLLDSVDVDLTALNAAIALKADIANVLELDNTSAFTPTADYHPATKKYIDDAAISLGTGDVVGPASALNSQVAIFSGTTGKLIASSGTVWGEVALITKSNLFTKAQYFDEHLIEPVGTNYVWDVRSYPVAKATLPVGPACTILNPSTLNIGSTYMLRVIQNAGGTATLNWGSVFKWPNGNAPTLTATPDAVDLFTFYSDGTYMYGIMAPNFS